MGTRLFTCSWWYYSSLARPYFGLAAFGWLAFVGRSMFSGGIWCSRGVRLPFLVFPAKDTRSCVVRGRVCASRKASSMSKAVFAAFHSANGYVTRAIWLVSGRRTLAAVRLVDPIEPKRALLARLDKWALLGLAVAPDWRLYGARQPLALRALYT